MGVTQLWQVLGPVEQHVPLSSLNGQTLAVDLSIWVCENQSVKQMQGVVAKPFLRNLFFRISHLTQLGVKLVFVIEGAAPELKWDTMVKRQQTRFPGRPGKQSPPKQAGKQTRRNFNCWLKECCELLEIMGIPYIQSKSEAEALCALLNAAGLVDGCLTNDGDAFLYGATRVYRNFTMNSKDPHVEMFNSSDIQSKLGIDRSGLVALGLLVGCDFVPKGVPGIGVANSVRLLQSLHGQDVLTRLQLWKSMAEKDCVDQVEVLARRKAIQVPEFPQTKVIDEFLVVKDRCPSQLPQWKRPVLAKLQEFALSKLEWPVEYTLEKILPLMTLWDMQDILQSRNPSLHQHLKPHRIVKTRVRQGEPCYEVEWNKPVTECMNEDLYYVTIESQELFSKCYTEVVKAFEDELSDNKKKPKAKKKKKKATNPTQPTPAVDNLSFQFGKINLNAVTSGLPKSVEDSHPSFTEYNESCLTTKAKQPRHLTLSPNSKKPATKTMVIDSRVDNSDSIRGNEASGSNIGKKLSFVNDVNQGVAEEEAVMSLSQRVKLRLQNKTESNKVTPATVPGKSIQNVRKNEASVPCASKSKISDINSPALCGSKQSSMGAATRTKDRKKSVQQMSSPSTDTFCSPVTYMKHKGGLGDSFEIQQRSPYYIECPSLNKQRSGVNALDINSPGFFSRPKSEPEPTIVDTKSTAEKLADKLDSGIQQVGCEAGNSGLFRSKKPGSAVDEQITLKSLQSLLNSSNGSIMTPKNTTTKACGLANQSALNSTNPSEFGDFQLQTSLMNSLCSSLVQALTPKGVSMTKSEYEQLVATLNEIESEENAEVTGDDGELVDLENSIDFAEIEKVSTNFKTMNQNLLLRPIQIDDEDVMSKLSKSARKKLRRKERKVQEMENMVKLQHMSQNKQKLNKKQESDLKTRLSHPNVDDNDGTKRKKQIICSPSKDSSKSKNHSHEGRNRGGHKHNSDSKSDSKLTKDVKSPDIRDAKSGKTNNIAAKVDGKSELKQANDAKLTQECRKQNGPVVDGDLMAEVNKKKKKRKKKVRKASPVIDLSGNDSVLDDSKIAVCAGLLKNALENSQKLRNENKIVKASPFMDLSADDTLLELEGISCKVAGEEMDSDLDTKLKMMSLKQKTLLSRQPASVAEVTENSIANNPPILSLVTMPTETDDGVRTDTTDVCSASKVLDDNDSKILQNSEHKCTCGQLGDVMIKKEQCNVSESASDNYFAAVFKSMQSPSSTGAASLDETHNEDVLLDDSDSDSSFKHDMQYDALTSNDKSHKWCYKMDDPNQIDGVENLPQVNTEGEGIPDENSVLEHSYHDDMLVVKDDMVDEDGVVVKEDMVVEDDVVVKDNVDGEVEDIEGKSVVDNINHVTRDPYGSDEDIVNQSELEEKQDTKETSSDILGNETSGLEILENETGQPKSFENEIRPLESSEKKTCVSKSLEDETCWPDVKNKACLTCLDTSNNVDYKPVNEVEVEHSENISQELADGNSMTDRAVVQNVGVSLSTVCNDLQNYKSENTSVDQINKPKGSSCVSEHVSVVNKDVKYEQGTFMDYWSGNEDSSSTIGEMYAPSKLTNDSLTPGSSNLLLDNVTSAPPMGLSSQTFDNDRSSDVVTRDISMNITETVVPDAGEEVAESPACLADRLKLKLTQRSTRNLLESFTNVK